MEEKPKRKPITAGGVIAIVLVLFVGYCAVVSRPSGSGSSSEGNISSPPEEEAIATTPPLLVRSWRCYTEYSYIFVEGEVQNQSPDKIDHLEAVATFSTSNGDLVKSDDAIVEYDPILPGQISPFKVGTTTNPAISKCDIGFKLLLGGTVDFVTQTDANIEAQELLSKLGYYDGPVDGKAGPATTSALREFAKKTGHGGGTDIMGSLRALRYEAQKAKQQKANKNKNGS